MTNLFEMQFWGDAYSEYFDILAGGISQADTAEQIVFWFERSNENVTKLS